MAFSRSFYDTCEYSRSLSENRSVLTWLLDPNKHYNCNPCRIDFGVVGGNNVSTYRGNHVDLESELRGQTRAYSRCPEKKYQPGTVIQGKDKRNVKHLRSCSLVQYKPRITHIGFDPKSKTCPCSKQDNAVPGYSSQLYAPYN